MKTSLEIAGEAHLDHIGVVAEKMGIPSRFVEYYGNSKAKINLNVQEEFAGRPPRRVSGRGRLTPSPNCSA